MPAVVDPIVRALIVRTAQKHGIDPAAALAVAAGEGGIRYGAVGDAGTSYGPFQLHVGGALPKGRGADWANSPAGIDYAIRTMAQAGARGLTGQAAVDAIVRKFERPADPDTSVRNAVGRLAQFSSFRDPGVAQMAPATTRPARAAAVSNPVDTSTINPILQSVYNANNELLGVPSIDLSLLGAAPTAKPGRAAKFPAAKTGRTPISPLPTPLTGRSEFMVADPEGAPSRKGGRYHAGKDWFAPAGSPVVAPINGRVIEVKQSRGNSGQVFGGTVKVQSPTGRVYVFRHVNPVGVRVGARVRQGDPIAVVTDWTDGSPHSHVEVWKTRGGGYRLENMLDPAVVFGRPEPSGPVAPPRTKTARANASNVDSFLKGFGQRVTSGYRTKAQNDAVGGAKDSFHLTGEARDIDHRSPRFPDLVAYVKAHPGEFREFFFDPLGWYVKNGRIYKGAIGGHGDHAHIVL